MLEVSEPSSVLSILTAYSSWRWNQQRQHSQAVFSDRLALDVKTRISQGTVDRTLIQQLLTMFTKVTFECTTSKHLDDHLPHEVLLHHDVAAYQLLHEATEFTGDQELLDLFSSLCEHKNNATRVLPIPHRLACSAPTWRNTYLLVHLGLVSPLQYHSDHKKTTTKNKKCLGSDNKFSDELF